jgi:isoquinoline 1-oxidoreductase subunit beta
LIFVKLRSSWDGSVRVRRVVCAVDCGIVVNPDTVRAQVQSASMFGITAALYGKITLKNGRVEQSNFDDYQMLRVDQAPSVEVRIVESPEPPGGMGEAGTSVIVPIGGVRRPSLENLRAVQPRTSLDRHSNRSL